MKDTLVFRHLGIFISSMLLFGSCASVDDEAARDPSSVRLRFAALFEEPLPAVLARRFGNATVVLREANEIKATYEPYRDAIEVYSNKGAPTLVRSGSTNPQGTFRLSGPWARVEPSTSPDLAKAVLEALYAKTYPASGPNDIAQQLQARLAAYGAAKLTGATPPSDEIAALWWRLRMEGVNRPLRLKRGDKILIGIRTYGYKGSNFTPGDFGHASFAFRTVGGDPDEDFVLNPGAKTPEGHKGSLLSSLLGDKNVPNKVGVANVWDWLEAQKKKRYLDLDLRLLVVSKEQARALELMKQEYARLEWGPFRMLSNNCADGARDLYNVLLPVDRAIGSGHTGRVTVPEEVLDAASELFGEWARLDIRSDTPPEGLTKTPDLGAEKLADRSQADVFKAFKEIEDDLY